MREILPKHTKFINYDITLKPNFENFTFEGDEMISIQILSQTDRIILNSKQLEILEAKIILSNYKFDSTDIIYDKFREEVSIYFDEELPIEQGLLQIKFIGILNDDMAGFYRSKYIDQNGNEKYAATTQFEAVDARRAFPCADEPSLKATFDITLVIPKDLTALSNMDIKKVIEDNNKKIVKFKTTPIMSTYLLAFFVGEVEYIEKIINKPISGENLRVRVYTPIGKKDQGNFALDLATDVISFYSTYFNIDLPLEKMDMIGIPDFSAGAMENWGLITYRTKYILYDSKETSQEMKTRIAYVICHELAHQWFGNLVTMEWWSDLWLNEGFATWIGWMATDYFFPEWKIWETFIGSEFNSALSLDQLENSHPIKNDVVKASQVDEIFDAITYSKGSCIIRMLVNYLGEEDFQKGLRKYLLKYQYSNAKTEDLWNSLSDASGKDIKKMMSSWTDFKGYPIVNAELDTDNKRIILKQEKYCTIKGKENCETCWVIPLNVINFGDKISQSVFSSNQDSSILYNENGIYNWIKLNRNQTGFYRTKYCHKLQNMLRAPIKNKSLGTIDRTEIIENMFNFVISGYGSLTETLNFLSAYEDENEYQVLLEIVSYLNLLISVWGTNQEIVEKIQNFGISFTKPLIEKLGWEYSNNEPESHQTGLLRNLVISSTGNWGDKEVINEARKKLNAFFGGDFNSLNTNLRESVFTIIMKYGNESDFDMFLEYYNKTDSDEIKNEILSAIGSAINPKLLLKALDFTYNSGKVKAQDMYFVATKVSPNNRYLLWEYTFKNWNRICQLFKNGSLLFGRIISCAIAQLYRREWIEEVDSFLSQHEDEIKHIRNKINQAKEKALAKINWFERDNDELCQWFNIAKLNL